MHSSLSLSIYLRDIILVCSAAKHRWIAELEMEKLEIVEGKVDWKGRQAIKSMHGGMKASLIALVSFGLESLATISLAVNFVTFFSGVMHYDIADAANMVTNYSGVSYILSILVAVLADIYIGRYKAAIISGCLEFAGLGLLALQAHYPKLVPPPCNILDPTAKCEKIGGDNAVLLYVGLYLLATGSSGTKATVTTHGADQYDEKDPKELNQMSSYFNCILLSVCIGAAVSITLYVWIQDNKGWGLGFGVAAITMFVAVVIFILGLPFYRIHVIENSSAVTEIIQVYVAAFRNRKLQIPEDPSELYEINDKEAGVEAEFLPHSDTIRFLDKAAIETSTTQFQNSQAPNPWRLCRVTQVENAKILLNIMPVFCCTIIMTLCLAQLQTFSIQQGLTMDTRITKSFKIPPASLPIVPIVFLIIIVPIYDRLIVPFIRKFTGLPTGITHLQRIGVGLILSSISMAAAALMEVKRKGVARDHHMLDAIPVLQPLPISVFWLSIQFFVFGIADMFTYVGLLEFFYSQAPKGLKSLSTCFLWTSMALGYFLSSIVVKIVNAATKGNTRSGGWLAGNSLNRNHLNLFYWLLSILSLINFCAYLFVSRRYQYRAVDSVAPDDNSNTKVIAVPADTVAPDVSSNTKVIAVPVDTVAPDDIDSSSTKVIAVQENHENQGEN